MRNRRVFVAALVVLLCSGNVQVGWTAPTWAKAIGSTGFEKPTSVRQTTDGGYIIAGYTSLGGNNAWVVKLKTDSTIEWQKTYGTEGHDAASSIRQTTDGGYVFAGMVGTDSPAIVKLKADGAITWTTDFVTGAPSADCSSIEQTADGGYIVAASSTYYQGIVIKLDQNGDVAWQKYGYAGTISCVRQTADGGYIVAGITGSSGAGNGDLIALKLSPDGSITWQKTYGGAWREWASDIHQTSDGGYVLAGYTESFGSGSTDAWVLKLRPDGTVAWQKTYGGAGEEQTSSVQQTADGGFILAGSTSSFGAPGSLNTWFVKLTHDGSVEWQKTCGLGWGVSLQQTTDGGYIATGETQSYGAGGSDALVLKLDAEGNCPTLDATSSSVTGITNVAPHDGVHSPHPNGFSRWGSSYQCLDSSWTVTPIAYWPGNPPPSITAISPPYGPLAGSTNVTISGSGFAGTVNVTFGASPATSITVNSAKDTITCQTPSATTTGTVDIMVVSSTRGTAIKSQAFTYMAGSRIDWVQRHPVVSPTARYCCGIAYDTARSRTVLFGGMNSPTAYLSDTWEWDGTTWTEHHPTNSPPARFACAMAYDPLRSRVVLFGGSNDGGSTVMSDTWEWDGTTWTQRHPVNSPSSSFHPAMAYDMTRGRILLVSGANGGLSTTWEWDGDSWTQRHPSTSPPSRYAQSLGYDAARGRVVLFGGRTASSSSACLSDTWEWDGTDWTQRQPTARPSARGGSAMSYDAIRSRMVLFGGWYGGPSSLSDTWEWDGTTWTQQQPATSPAGRDIAAMTYDPVRGRMVLFGGNTGMTLSDTWEYGTVSDAPTITAVSPFFGPLAGSTNVTISGSGFAGTVNVTFGASPATNIIVDSSTQIRCQTPPEATSGSVTVTVSSSTNGSASSPNAFTYSGPGADVTGLTALPGAQEIALSWTNPADPTFSGVTVVRRSDRYPTGPTDGLTAYSGMDHSFIDSGLTDGTVYYHKVFALYSGGNPSAGACVASVSGLDPRIPPLEQKVKVLEQSIKDKDTLISQQASEITSLRARIEELTNSCDQASREKDLQIAQLQSTVSQQASQITSLTATIAQKTGEISQLQSTNTQLVQQVATLTTQVDQLTVQIATLNTRITQLEQRIRELEGQIDPTIPVTTTVRLIDSLGNPLAGAAVTYYQSGWKTFGTTQSDGSVTLALQRGSYSFAVTYAFGRLEKTQNIATDPNVVFQTKRVAVQLKGSTGNPISSGNVQYYASGWRTFGTIANGEASLELLPGSYTFAVNYAFGRLEKAQNVATDSTVIFQTKRVTVQFRDSAGNPISSGDVQYYASGWRTFGTIANGEAALDLMPGSYTFAVNYAFGRNEKAQNVASDPTVVFQTKNTTVELRNHAGELISVTASVQYYASGWRTFGETANGAVNKELLPGTYTFAIVHAFARNEKAQDLNASATVTFQTGLAHSDSGSCTHYYASGWRSFTQDAELLSGSYSFRFSTGTPAEQTFAISAGTVNTLR